MKSIFFSFVFLVSSASLSAAEPFRFPEATHGNGSLKYINGVPVLTVAGTHAEMGEQMGMLAVRHVKAFPEILKKAIEIKVGKVGLVAATFAAKSVFDKFPTEYRDEIEAIAKSSGVELNSLIVANCISDLESIFGCAGLIVEPSRSKTGEVIFGRNLDISPIEGIHQYSMVVIFKPTGKRSFVSVAMPGFVGVGAGMNDAGLCIGGNTVTKWADGSPKTNPKGMSVMIASRIVMQECNSLDEMEKWLRKQSVMAPGIVPSADVKGGAIFEITTKTIERFPADRDVACATNHFQSAKLTVKESCRRLDILVKSRNTEKLGVDDVFGILKEANQGVATMQTMVFRPKSLAIHVAFGDGLKPATDFPLRKLEIADLFKR